MTCECKRVSMRSVEKGHLRAYKWRGLSDLSRPEVCETFRGVLSRRVRTGLIAGIFQASGEDYGTKFSERCLAGTQ